MGRHFWELTLQLVFSFPKRKDGHPDFLTRISLIEIQDKMKIIVLYVFPLDLECYRKVQQPTFGLAV